ncbi:hypothetical protein D3C81_2156640 [compost metagenome]
MDQRPKNAVGVDAFQDFGNTTLRACAGQSCFSKFPNLIKIPFHRGTKLHIVNHVATQEHPRQGSTQIVRK